MIRCDNCGYEWRPRGGKKSKKCPSCNWTLGETKARKWRRAEKKFAELLALRGWRLGPIGGRKTLDIVAERNGRKLFVDVKAGLNYLLRPSQLKRLLEYHDEKTDVGFACEMNGKFYLFILKDIP